MNAAYQRSVWEQLLHKRCHSRKSSPVFKVFYEIEHGNYYDQPHCLRRMETKPISQWQADSRP